MKRLLLALLCAAPLVSGTPVETAQADLPPEPSAQVELMYVTSMGCDLADCADPTHYHLCPAGCADPTHYHACPVGCADPTHPHCGQCWEVTEETAQAPAAPAHCHDDCPYDCPQDRLNRACGYGGHHRGYGGHHGGWRN